APGCGDPLAGVDCGNETVSLSHGAEEEGSVRGSSLPREEVSGLAAAGEFRGPAARAEYSGIFPLPFGAERRGDIRGINPGARATSNPFEINALQDCLSTKPCGPQGCGF